MGRELVKPIGVSFFSSERVEQLIIMASSPQEKRRKVASLAQKLTQHVMNGGRVEAYSTEAFDGEEFPDDDIHTGTLTVTMTLGNVIYPEEKLEQGANLDREQEEYMFTLNGEDLDDVAINADDLFVDIIGDLQFKFLANEEHPAPPDNMDELTVEAFDALYNKEPHPTQSEDISVTLVFME